MKITVADQIKFQAEKLSKIKLSMNKTDKQLKYLHYHLETWIQMNI